MAMERDAAQKPQFFKVLLPQFFEKLPIPRKFIQHLARDNPQRVTLESPLGKPWHVSIQRDGPNLCFGNGWKEFRRAHNLSAGFFLVFCYEGDLVFSFKAFDLSACQKEYTPVARELSRREKTEADRVDMLVPESRPGSSSRCARPRACKRDSNNISRGQPSTHSLARKKLVENRRAEKAVAISTSSCRGKKLPRFEKIIRAHSLTRHFMMLPSGFCASNGMLSKSEMILRDPKKGRLWTVGLCHGVAHQHLGKGWKKFAEDSNLRKGDKCIFKLVSKEIMDVQIVKR